MSEAIPEDERLSSDAQFSTYEPYTPTPEEEEQYPPPGPATVQTKGLPTETAQPKRTSTSTPRRSSASASNEG